MYIALTSISDSSRYNVLGIWAHVGQLKLHQTIVRQVEITVKNKEKWKNIRYEMEGLIQLWNRFIVKNITWAWKK